MTPFPAQFPADDDRAAPLPPSDLLIRIVGERAGDEISIGELVDGLGDRAFGIMLLILTLPVAMPGPPGLPTAFGIPLLIVTAQMWLGHRRPWLPAFICRRKISRRVLLAALHRARPTLKRLESICWPRWLALTTRRGERWLGAFFFLCAIVLINPIPIPFSHLPLALALVILALGFVERDGVVIIAGAIGSLIGIAINISLMGGIFVLGAKLLHLV